MQEAQERAFGFAAGGQAAKTYLSDRRTDSDLKSCHPLQPFPYKEREGAGVRL